MTAALRKQIGEAHDAEMAARADVEKAQEAMQRGQFILARMEREMAAFSDLDGAVARHRAAAIRAGSVIPPLPGDLSERLVARAKLADEIAGYQAAFDELAGDCRREETRVAQARGAKTTAVLSILSEDGAAMARELIELEKRAFEIRLRIEALGKVWAPAADGAMALVPMTDDTRAAIMSRYDRHVFPVEYDRASQVWIDYRDRLMADATATLDTASDDREAA